MGVGVKIGEKIKYKTKFFDSLAGTTKHYFFAKNYKENL